MSLLARLNAYIEKLRPKCTPELGWTDERWAMLCKDITEASQMNANTHNPAFWNGLKFLARHPLGYGKLLVNAEWRFSPNGSGPSIIKLDDGDFRHFKIRDILRGESTEDRSCGLMTYGLDAEFVVGKHGKHGATSFFRSIGARQSSEDGSGWQTWEHRTPPSDNIRQQISNLYDLQKELAKFLRGKKDYDHTPLKLNRTFRPCGTHVHIHTHTGFDDETLTNYLGVLANVWNSRPYNLRASKARWSCDYGDPSDAREPAWQENNNCDEGLSTEYRGFTSPDFSKRQHVRQFGALLRCVDWLLKNPCNLRPIEHDPETFRFEFMDDDGDCGCGDGYKIFPAYCKMARRIFRTPDIREVLRNV